MQAFRARQARQQAHPRLADHRQRPIAPTLAVCHQADVSGILHQFAHPTEEFGGRQRVRAVPVQDLAQQWDAAIGGGQATEDHLLEVWSFGLAVTEGQTRRRRTVVVAAQTLPLVGAVEAQRRGVEVQEPCIQAVVADDLDGQTRHQLVEPERIQVIQRLRQPLFRESF
jgi:hypothetical protein